MTASAPDDDPLRLDGNGAAGVLRELFVVEMTIASCACADCGRRSPVGALHLYGGAMGSVLRCPSCEALVLTITSGPAGWFVELRGIVHVPLAAAGRADGGPEREATTSSLFGQ